MQADTSKGLTHTLYGVEWNFWAFPNRFQTIFLYPLRWFIPEDIFSGIFYTLNSYSLPYRNLSGASQRNSPGWELSRWELSRWELSQWELFRGGCPRGNCPRSCLVITLTPYRNWILQMPLHMLQLGKIHVNLLLQAQFCKISTTTRGVYWTILLQQLDTGRPPCLLNVLTIKYQRYKDKVLPRQRIWEHLQQIWSWSRSGTPCKTSAGNLWLRQS